MKPSNFYLIILIAILSSHSEVVSIIQAKLNSVLAYHETVKSDYFFEYSTQELASPSPISIYSSCLLTCTSELGWPTRCLAASIGWVSQTCTCGIIDYSNKVFNQTSEIDLYVNIMCKGTEGNLIFEYELG